MIANIVAGANRPEVRQFAAGVVAGTFAAIAGTAIGDYVNKRWNRREEAPAVHGRQQNAEARKPALSAMEQECVERERAHEAKKEQQKAKTPAEELDAVKLERTKLELEKARWELERDRRIFEKRKSVQEAFNKPSDKTNDKKGDKKSEKQNEAERRTVKAAPARSELCVAMPRAMRTPRPRSAHRAR